MLSLKSGRKCFLGESDDNRVACTAANTVSGEPAVGETEDKLCLNLLLSLFSRTFYDVSNDFSLENWLPAPFIFMINTYKKKNHIQVSVNNDKTNKHCGILLHCIFRTCRALLIMSLCLIHYWDERWDRNISEHKLSLLSISSYICIEVNELWSQNFDMRIILFD